MDRRTAANFHRSFIVVDCNDVEKIAEVVSTDLRGDLAKHTYKRSKGPKKDAQGIPSLKH
jgi:hypothetical protein